MAHVAHRLDREQAGLADARLEITHLGELVPRRLVDRHVESVLAHHQDALRAQRELGVEPQVAQQVGDDRPVELVLHRVQVLAHRRIGKVAGIDELEHFGVRVEALAEPVADGLFAALEDDVEQRRHRQDRASVASARRVEQMVVAECSTMATPIPGSKSREARLASRAPASRDPAPRRSPSRRRA